MLSLESWATITLHQARRLTPIWSGRGADTHISATLLDDDAEDDSLVNSDTLRRGTDGIPDEADILTGVAGLQHAYKQKGQRVSIYFKCKTRRHAMF